MENGTTKFMHNERRDVALDYLRVISTLLIIVYHFNIQLGFHNIEAAVFSQMILGNHENIGSLGITLFIIISGTGLTLSNIRNNNQNYITFIKKRIRSIFPIYYICYVITFLVLFYRYKVVPFKGPSNTIILSLLCMDGFLFDLIPNCYLCGEWFIGFIIILYLIYPFLYNILSTGKKRLLFLTLLFVFLFVVYYFNLDQRMLFEPTRNPALRILDFVFGILSAMLISSNDMIGRLEWGIRRTNKKWIVFGIALICFFTCALSDESIPHNIRAFLIGSSIFIMIYDLISSTKILTSEKANLIITFLSRISFSAILVHHNIIALLIEPFNNMQLSLIGSYSLFCICLLIILLVAWALERLSRAIIEFCIVEKYSK